LRFGQLHGEAHVANIARAGERPNYQRDCTAVIAMNALAASITEIVIVLFSHDATAC
jgi:hypothetical protein